VSAEPASAQCVFCRVHPVHPAWRPFCSERCKLQDLARWADGTYTIAGENAETPEEDDSQDSQKGKGQN
jgi:endogenous inhibitor of DNA gyrase (YacG/DUF329 family)